MRVVWTDRAKLRLREIHDTIAKDRPRAAPKVVRRLVLRSSQLSLLPQSGRVVPEYERDDIRQILERPYITVYHYRQLLPSDLAHL